MNDTPKRDMPYATQTKNTLRDKIGKNVQMSQIFTPDVLKECQDMINTAQDDFYSNALDYLSLIEAENKQAQVTPEQSELSVRKIAQTAFQLKSLMEALGLIFGFEVAQSLYQFAHATKKANSQTLMVISKHVDVLHVVLRDKDKSDKNPIAREMIDSLSKLIKKVAAA